jgi:hypothetical protein
MGNFALLEPDPDSESGAGSTDLIETGYGSGSGPETLIFSEEVKVMATLVSILYEM